MRSRLALALLWIGLGACGGEAPEATSRSPADEASDPFLRHAGAALDAQKSPGAELLALARESDPTLRGYLADHPGPDLLFPLRAEHLKLIYLRQDRVTTFVREGPARASQAHERRPIPEPFLALLPAVFQAAVRGARAGGEPAGSEVASSTCFAVAPDGHLLTAYHAVNGAGEIRVRLADGRELRASVERADRDHDLALLRVQADALPYLALGDSDDARHGTRVFTFGFPAVPLLGREPKFTEGVVSSLGAPARPWLLLSLPVLPGNSGGPVLDESGRVLGVLTRVATPQRFLAVTGVLPQGISFATPVEFAVPLLDPAPELPAAASREAAIERALGAVCLIDARP
jgi:S1-C subfamily serine protease